MKKLRLVLVLIRCRINQEYNLEKENLKNTYKRKNRHRGTRYKEEEEDQEKRRKIVEEEGNRREQNRKRRRNIR